MDDWVKVAIVLIVCVIGGIVAVNFQMNAKERCISEFNSMLTKVDVAKRSDVAMTLSQICGCEKENSK